MVRNKSEWKQVKLQLSSIQSEWKQDGNGPMRTERGCNLDSPTTWVPLFKSCFSEIHTYQTICTTHQTHKTHGKPYRIQTLYASSPQWTHGWLWICLLLSFFQRRSVFRLVCNCKWALYIPWEGCLCTGTAWRHRRNNLLPDWPALRWRRLSSYLLEEQATFKSI